MGIAYNTSIVRDGLVLHLDAANVKSYPGSGSVWGDLSGNSNNGTLVNGPTFDGNSISFDGVNDFSDHGDILDMGTDDMTIVAWIRPSSIATANDWFVSKAAAANQSFRYAFGVLANTNQPRIFFCPQAGIDKIGLGDTSLSINTWYMLTGMWNRAGDMQIYINGQVENMTGTKDISSYSASNIQSTNPYRIGAYTADNNISPFNAFDGDISSVMHYTRLLSANEVKQNFEALRGRYGI